MPGAVKEKTIPAMEEIQDFKSVFFAPLSPKPRRFVFLHKIFFFDKTKMAEFRNINLPSLKL